MMPRTQRSTPDVSGKSRVPFISVTGGRLLTATIPTAATLSFADMAAIEYILVNNCRPAFDTDRKLSWLGNHYYTNWGVNDSLPWAGFALRLRSIGTFDRTVPMKFTCLVYSSQAPVNPVMNLMFEAFSFKTFEALVFIGAKESGKTRALPSVITYTGAYPPSNGIEVLGIPYPPSEVTFRCEPITSGSLIAQPVYGRLTTLRRRASRRRHAAQTKTKNRKRK